MTRSTGELTCQDGENGKTNLDELFKLVDQEQVKYCVRVRRRQVNTEHAEEPTNCVNLQTEPQIDEQVPS